MMHYSLLPFFLLKNPPPTLQLLCISCRSSSGSGPHAFKHSAHPGELRWVLHYNQANDYKTEACFPLPPPPSPLLSSFLPFCLGFSCSLFTSLHTPFQERKIRISPLSSPFLPPLLFSFPFLFSLFTKNVSAEAVQAPSLLFSDADEWDQLSWAGADQGCPSGWSPKHSWSFVAPPWCIPWCMV